MIINFIYLFTSFFGLLVLYLIGFKYKPNRKTNSYLIIFFFLSSLRFLFYGFAFLTFFNQKVIYFDVLFNLTAWPCLYLYFQNLINNRNSDRYHESYHFIIPLLLFLVFCIQSVVFFDVSYFSKIALIIIMFLNCYYFYSSYSLLSKTVWKRKSKILLINDHFLVLRKWTKFLFILLTLMFLRVLLNLFLNDKMLWYHNHNYYLWIGALFWITLFFKIVTTPDVLYGYNLLQGRIEGYDKSKINFEKLWKKDYNKKVLNVQDAVLKDRLSNSIQDYIIEIEHISLNTNLFFSIDFTIVDLANKLNIPKSHLFYVFKYHSNLSFTDFKKLVRIQKAIAMIGQGYLKTNTMEALAIDVGFYSYSPFFKSFKAITGESPYEFQKLKDNSLRLI